MRSVDYNFYVIIMANKRMALKFEERGRGARRARGREKLKIVLKKSRLKEEDTCNRNTYILSGGNVFVLLEVE